MVRLMPLSYTQNMEDYHLSLAFAGQASGIYIDIGAGHPVADNVSLWFYERGWSGIVVEPQADLASLYPRIRPRDRIHQGLIGRQNGTVDFYRVDRLNGLSTTVPAHAEGARTLGAAVATECMPTITLAALCERYDVADIDFLKIDVEGAEADVIAGNDWTRFRPKVVVAEAVTPLAGAAAWADWEPVLLAHGYRFRLFDTLNRFYVAEEYPDIFARLPAERAPWDAVTHMYEIGRAPVHTAHPDHAMAQQLVRGFWASLPHLDEELVADLLRRAGADVLPGEALRIALGRIACGYDGGQIIED